jgi:HEPN domain-containing protein
VAKDVADRSSAALDEAMEGESVPALTARTTSLHVVAGELLGAVPDDLFIAAIEVGEEMAVAYAFEAGGIIDFHERFERTVTDLFVTSGVPYEFEDGQLVPTMSPAVSTTSVAPAVDVLEDSRLTEVRAHYVEALRRLQEPDPDEAVDEARHAVEAALLAVLDARGIARPDKHQANDLFNVLVSNGLERDAEELVLAVPRFRGRTRAGHAGRPPVTLDEAQAAVAAAGGALLYLAGKLP